MQQTRNQTLRPTRKHRLFFIAAAFVVLLAIVFIFSKKTVSAEAASNSAKGIITQPALTVTLAVAQTGNWMRTLSANGSIAAWQESLISSELGGMRLLALSAQVGDNVKRGQLLATFSDALLKAELAQQSAVLAETQATLAEAQSNLRRALLLKESGAISVQQITQYATVRNTVFARMSAAKAGVQAATLRLQQTRISAPDDGIISARAATVGAVVQSGQELFRLIRQGKLEWRAEVSAEDSSRLSPGQTASIVALDGSIIKGSIRMVAPTVDPQTRKALVYVDLPVAPGASAGSAPLKNIRPGMFAKGEFLIAQNTSLSVPASAVVLRDGYSSVFVPDASQKVKQVRVSTGKTQQGRVEIVSGLAPGNQVVDSGAGFLADGDTVRIVKAEISTAVPADPAARKVPTGK